MFGVPVQRQDLEEGERDCYFRCYRTAVGSEVSRDLFVRKIEGAGTAAVTTNDKFSVPCCSRHSSLIFCTVARCQSYRSTANRRPQFLVHSFINLLYSYLLPRLLSKSLLVKIANSFFIRMSGCSEHDECMICLSSLLPGGEDDGDGSSADMKPSHLGESCRHTSKVNDSSEIGAVFPVSSSLKC